MLVFSRTSFLVFSQNFDEDKKMRLEEIEIISFSLLKVKSKSSS